MQNAPNGADQNVVGALRLRGSLKEKALERALQLVMERHDALRTHFLRHADGSLHQVGSCICQSVDTDIDYTKALTAPVAYFSKGREGWKMAAL